MAPISQECKGEGKLTLSLGDASELITFVNNSSGDLMACLSGQKMGNILEKSYDEIVHFDNMQEFIRTVKASNFFCNHCPLKEELIA